MKKQITVTPKNAPALCVELEGQLEAAEQQLSDARSELMKTEQKAIDYDLSDLEGLVTENEALKLQVSAAKTVIASQEPEPMAWVWQSDNYATRFSQRIFELFDEADDMRNRHGGNLYPLYFEASPNAKRIAELGSACKAHAELHEINEKRIFELEGAIGVVNGEYALLRDCYNEVTDRIANGVRVTAWVDDNSTLSCIECIDSDKGNATLILDKEDK